MKPSQIYATLLAASLVFAASVQAQSNPSDSTSTAAIARVAKDAVKDRFTAKDLIGAGLYDRTGEKIGDIADIDLQAAVPGPLATSFNADHAADRSIPAAGQSEGATRAPRSTTMTGADTSLAHATVFVSVGGLFGMGDDLVSVPVAQLSYNAEDDRFEISAAKADVVALAEGKDHAGYAAGSSTPDTAAGKQSFSEEATRVQNALKSDPSTSAFASSVTVVTDGESLSVHGIVDTKEQEKLILEAARRATSLDIEDKIDVR